MEKRNKVIFVFLEDHGRIGEDEDEACEKKKTKRREK